MPRVQEKSGSKASSTGQFRNLHASCAGVMRDVSSKIEWICDEEIKEAVRFVLNSQYSTLFEDLIVQASRVLGIKTTRKNTWERIEKLVRSGIESNDKQNINNWYDLTK